MITTFTVDLDEPPFTALVTVEARRDYLTKSLLEQIARTTDSGPLYVSVRDDYETGLVYSRTATGLLQAIGDVLAPWWIRDEDDEVRAVTAASDYLLRWLELHEGLDPSTLYGPRSGMVGEEPVTAVSVIEGVGRLRQEPRLAELAANPATGRARVALERDALLQGHDSLADVVVEDAAQSGDEVAAEGRIVGPAPIDLGSIDLAYTATAAHGTMHSTSREAAVDDAADLAMMAASRPGRRSAPPSRRDRARAAQRWELNREYLAAREPQPQQHLEQDR